MAFTMMATATAILLAVMACQLEKVDALRSGAPTMACFNMRPFHGLHRPKPASASQFFVRQSSYTYGPDQNITVEIMTHSNERKFRGFMVQSYDPVNGQRIGEFLPTEVAQPMSCSSATHRNHQEKKHVVITWRPKANDAAQASADQLAPVSEADLGVRQSLSTIGSWLGLPASSTGGLQKRFLGDPVANQVGQRKQVRFRATIVVSYDEYYTGFESSDLSFEPFDYLPSSTRKPARR